MTSASAPAFHDVLEAIGQLSIDQRETLVEIVRKQLHAERRQQLLLECNEAQEEYRQGKLKPQTAKEIVDELFQ